jgi:hypothetical protein
MAPVEIAQMPNDFLGSVQGQEVPAALYCHHIGRWYEPIIMFSFMRFGPILIAPEKEHWNLDAVIVLGRSLPAFSVSKETDERPVMSFPVSRRIHLSQQ